MNPIRSEGFKIPGRPVPRPDLRRPLSDGSMAIDINDLTSITPFQQQTFQYPTESFDFSMLARPKAKQRKLSMNEPRPRERMPARAMSFSAGLGFERESISPPEYMWENSLPSILPSSMQSFGSTIDDMLESPVTPALPLLSDDEQKKQRRRECHNLVEKRRREHINAKIEELSQLLPAQYSIEIEEEEDDDSKKKRRSSMKAKDAQCKGQVLTQSVAYIHDLRHITQAQAARIQQLESWLASSQQPVMPIWDQSPEPLQSMWQPHFSPRDHPSSGSSHSFPQQPSEPSPPSPAQKKLDLPIALGNMDLEGLFRKDEENTMRW